MNDVILSPEYIQQENIRMRLEEESLTLLHQYPKIITSQSLLRKLREDPLPSLPIHKKILENRNLKNITEEIPIENGITIERAILRFLPTTESFYKTPIVEENIATVVPYGTPLLIFHQSLDHLWYYVQTPFYRGWISKNSVLCITEAERKIFEHPKQFIVITSPVVPFHHSFLDLGTTFPLLGVHAFFYEALIPFSDGLHIEKISKQIAYHHYLKYTRQNILEIAKKNLDIPYYWGAIEDGLDCSFLIQSLFRVFGFQLPRDTKSLEKVMGFHKIDLNGKTEVEKKTILSSIPYPAILHKKGHILLAINPQEVIHAYGDAKKVICSSIDCCYGTNLYPLLTSVSILIPS